MIVFTDGVEGDIVSFIGNHKPERGGAILGPPNSNIVSRFVYDEDAVTTSVSYTPSRSLVEKVRKLESETGLVYKGAPHSHPGDYDELSGGDKRSIAEHLDANPHQVSFLAPIVNLRKGPVPKAPHILDLGNGISLTCYEAYRSRKKSPGFHRGQPGWSPIEISRVAATVMPVDAAALEVAIGLPAPWINDRVETGHIRLSGLHYEVRIVKGAGSELQLLFPPGFPASKPVALLTQEIGNEKPQTQELLFPWRLCGKGVSELAHHVLPLITANSTLTTSTERNENNGSETRSEQAA